MPRRRAIFCEHCGYAQRKRDTTCDNCGMPTASAVAKDRADMYEFGFKLLLAAGLVAWMYFRVLPGLGVH